MIQKFFKVVINIDEDQQELLVTAGMSTKQFSHYGSQFGIFSLNKLSRYERTDELYPYKPCTQMFIEAFFIIPNFECNLEGF
jgi:hypothetical protein